MNGGYDDIKKRDLSVKRKIVARRHKGNLVFSDEESLESQEDKKALKQNKFRSITKPFVNIEEFGNTVNGGNAFKNLLPSSKAKSTSQYSNTEGYTPVESIIGPNRYIFSKNIPGRSEEVEETSVKELAKRLIQESNKVSTFHNKFYSLIILNCLKITSPNAI